MNELYDAIFKYFSLFQPEVDECRYGGGQKDQNADSQTPGNIGLLYRIDSGP